MNKKLHVGGHKDKTSAEDWVDCAEQCYKSSTCINWQFKIEELKKICIQSANLAAFHQEDDSFAGRKNTCLGKKHQINHLESSKT